MTGPCCFSSNIQAAKVLGIIFVIFSLLSIVAPITQGITDAGAIIGSIVAGIIGALFHGTLIYGAHKQNSTAILVWMILAIIQCVVIGIAGIVMIAIIATEVVRLKLEV